MPSDALVESNRSEVHHAATLLTYTPWLDPPLHHSVGLDLELQQDTRMMH